MDMDFATSCPLVRPALPHIRFLFVGSRLCSTLPSDGPSRFRPCALLVLHLHQVAQGTFTPKLSDMSDTQDAARRLTPVAFGDPCPGPPLQSWLELGRDEATAPSIELSNWDWCSRAAGGWWARARVAARYCNGRAKVPMQRGAPARSHRAGHRPIRASWFE